MKDFELNQSVSRLLTLSIARVRRIYWMRGVAATLAVGILGALVAMAADVAFTIFSEGTRWALTLGLYGLVLAAAGWFLARPLLRRLDFRRMAKILDSRHPENEECLTTLVELVARADETGSPGCSLALFDILRKKATEAADRIDLEKEFTARTFVVRLKWLVGTVLVLLLSFVTLPHLAGRLFVRAVAPWVDVGNLHAGDIVVEPGDVVVLKGSTVRITAKVDERLHSAPWIRISRRTTFGWGEEFAERLSSDGVYEATATMEESEWRYRVSAGPAVTRYYTVRVCEMPKYELFEARVKYPEYTHWPESVVSNAEVGTISAVEGSVVAFRCEIVEQGVRADLRVNGGALPRYACVSNREAAWSLELVNADGFRSPRQAGLVKSFLDRPPTVVVEKPVVKAVTLPPHAKLPLEITATDDIGPSTPVLRYRVDDGDWIDWRRLAVFGRRGVSLWQGSDVIDLSELDLAMASRVTFDLTVADGYPAALGGPHAATSTPVTVTLKLDAGNFEMQGLGEQVSNVRKLLDEAERRLNDAATPAQWARDRIRSEGKVSEDAERNVEKSAHEVGEATKRLNEIADRLGATAKFRPVAEAVRRALEERVAPAMRRLEEAQFADAARRAEELDKAIPELRNAANAVRELRTPLQERAKMLEAYERTKDLADRQQALAAAARDILSERPADTRKLEAWRRMEEEATRQARDLARTLDDPKFDEVRRQMEKASARMSDMKRELDVAADDKLDAAAKEQRLAALRQEIAARRSQALREAETHARQAEQLIDNSRHQTGKGAENFLRQAEDAQRQAEDALARAEAETDAKDLQRQAREAARDARETAVSKTSTAQEQKRTKARALELQRAAVRELASVRQAEEAAERAAREAQEAAEIAARPDAAARADAMAARAAKDVFDRAQRNQTEAPARQAAAAAQKRAAEAQKRALDALAKKDLKGAEAAAEEAVRQQDEAARKLVEAHAPAAVRDVQEAAIRAQRELVGLPPAGTNDVTALAAALAEAARQAAAAQEEAVRARESEERAAAAAETLRRQAAEALLENLAKPSLPNAQALDRLLNEDVQRATNETQRAAVRAEQAEVKALREAKDEISRAVAAKALADRAAGDLAEAGRQAAAARDEADRVVGAAEKVAAAAAEEAGRQVRAAEASAPAADKALERRQEALEAADERRHDVDEAERQAKEALSRGDFEGFKDAIEAAAAGQDSLLERLVEARVAPETLAAAEAARAAQERLAEDIVPWHEATDDGEDLALAFETAQAAQEAADRALDAERTATAAEAQAAREVQEEGFETAEKLKDAEVKQLDSMIAEDLARAATADDRADARRERAQIEAIREAAKAQAAVERAAAAIQRGDKGGAVREFQGARRSQEMAQEALEEAAARSAEGGRTEAEQAADAAAEEAQRQARQAAMEAERAAARAQGTNRPEDLEKAKKAGEAAVAAQREAQAAARRALAETARADAADAAEHAVDMREAAAREAVRAERRAEGELSKMAALGEEAREGARARRADAAAKRMAEEAAARTAADETMARARALADREEALVKEAKDYLAFEQVEAEKAADWKKRAEEASAEAQTLAKDLTESRYDAVRRRLEKAGRQMDEMRRRLEIAADGSIDAATKGRRQEDIAREAAAQRTKAVAEAEGEARRAEQLLQRATEQFGAEAEGTLLQAQEAQRKVDDALARAEAESEIRSAQSFADSELESALTAVRNADYAPLEVRPAKGRALEAQRDVLRAFSSGRNAAEESAREIAEAAEDAAVAARPAADEAARANDLASLAVKRLREAEERAKTRATAAEAAAAAQKAAEESRRAAFAAAATNDAVTAAAALAEATRRQAEAAEKLVEARAPKDVVAAQESALKAMRDFAGSRPFDWYTNGVGNAERFARVAEGLADAQKAASAARAAEAAAQTAERAAARQAAEELLEKLAQPTDLNKLNIDQLLAEDAAATTNLTDKMAVAAETAVLAAVRDAKDEQSRKEAGDKLAEIAERDRSVTAAAAAAAREAADRTAGEAAEKTLETEREVARLMREVAAAAPSDPGLDRMLAQKLKEDALAEAERLQKEAEEARQRADEAKARGDESEMAAALSEAVAAQEAAAEQLADAQPAEEVMAAQEEALAADQAALAAAEKIEDARQAAAQAAAEKAAAEKAAEAAAEKQNEKPAEAADEDAPYHPSEEDEMTLDKALQDAARAQDKAQQARAAEQAAVEAERQAAHEQAEAAHELAEAAGRATGEGARALDGLLAEDEAAAAEAPKTERAAVTREAAQVAALKEQAAALQAEERAAAALERGDRGEALREMTRAKFSQDEATEALETARAASRESARSAAERKADQAAAQAQRAASKAAETARQATEQARASGRAEDQAAAVKAQAAAVEAQREAQSAAREALAQTARADMRASGERARAARAAAEHPEYRPMQPTEKGAAAEPAERAEASGAPEAGEAAGTPESGEQSGESSGEKSQEGNASKSETSGGGEKRAEKPQVADDPMQAAQAAAEQMRGRIDDEARDLDLDGEENGSQTGESSSGEPSKEKAGGGGGGVRQQLRELADELKRNDDPNLMRSLLEKSGWFKVRGTAKDGLGVKDLESVPAEYRDLVRRYFLRLAEETKEQK